MKLHRQRTELELFEAVGRGDVSALREYNARIERCVRWKLGMGSGVEVGEVCGRARAKLEGLRRRGFSGNNQAFRSYFYRVVASQIVEVRRERGIEVSLDSTGNMPEGETGPPGKLAKLVADPHWDALEGLTKRQEQELARSAFAKLDERCRQLLWEREVEQAPEKEISARLKMSLSNVWTSIHRCKESLSRLLFVTLCGQWNSDWHEKVSRLAKQLVEPLATIFVLWWEKNHTIRAIARMLGREEREVKVLLARAKAAVWRLAQEAGGL